MAEDARIAALLIRAKTEADVEAARELLEIAADILKSRRPLPALLADHIASAFKRAANKEFDTKRRAQDLAFNLGLVRKDGRPSKKLPKGEMALAVAVYGDAEAEFGLRTAVAEAHGDMTKNTAKAKIQEAREGLEEARKHIGNIRLRKGGLDQG